MLKNILMKIQWKDNFERRIASKSQTINGKTNGFNLEVTIFVQCHRLD